MFGVTASSFGRYSLSEFNLTTATQTNRFIYSSIHFKFACKTILSLIQVVKLILQGILLTPPDLAPPLICQLLNGCWKTQPSDRITFAEIHSKLHRRNSFKQHRQNSSSSDDELSPKTVTYVHLRHERNDDYLQPLPDLHPHHTYSNTQI